MWCAPFAHYARFGPLSLCFVHTDAVFKWSWIYRKYIEFRAHEPPSEKSKKLGIIDTRVEMSYRTCQFIMNDLHAVF